MALLSERIEKQGNWLFRWRSYLPFIVTPIVFIALRKSELLEKFFGDSVETIWGFLCLAISFFGFLIRCLTAGYAPRGTSGRNTRYQVAETLNTTGMYSIVRNPLYLGNFIIVFGVILSIQVWWLVLMFIVGFWVYYERIIFTEEEFLRKKFGSIFIAWAKRTPIFIPNLKNWQEPTLAFSFKAVLRREFSTFFAIIATFTFLDIMEDLFSEGKFELNLAWGVIFLAGLIIYIALFLLKKKTNLLDVSGR